MKYVLLTALLLIASACSAQAPTTSTDCQTDTLNERPIPSELVSHLGPWNSCSLEVKEADEFRTYALTIIEWDNVKLTIETSPPETTIYIVSTSGRSPLTPEWYSQNRENLVDDFFQMDWDFNKFPGPSSEYFVSPSIGTNAQFWAERDNAGNVTWVRFSFAL